MSSNIKPNDILQKKFSPSRRGLKPDEVYDFLSLIASEFEKLLQQNKTLSSKAKELEEAIDEYRNMEATLKSTLISSQRIAQQVKEDAEREGNVIIRESELEAERIIQKAKQRKDRLEEETFQLLNQHRRFRAEFVSLIETHGKMIQTQDSRIMLEHGLKPDDATLAPEPEIEAGDGKHKGKSGFGDEGAEELEFLFPEEK